MKKCCLPYEDFLDSVENIVRQASLFYILNEVLQFVSKKVCVAISIAPFSRIERTHSLSIHVQCSIVLHPALSAAMMPALP